jgi:hypothetical protein
VRSQPVNQLSLAKPSANIFQHVNALVSAFPQGPEKQRLKQSCVAVARLKIYQPHSLQAKDRIVAPVKNGVSRDAMTVDNRGYPQVVL